MGHGSQWALIAVPDVFSWGSAERGSKQGTMTEACHVTPDITHPESMSQTLTSRPDVRCLHCTRKLTQGHKVMYRDARTTKAICLEIPLSKPWHVPEIEQSCPSSSPNAA